MDWKKSLMLLTVPLDTRGMTYHTATGETPGLSQEAETGTRDRFRLESLLGFPQERQDRTK